MSEIAVKEYRCGTVGDTVYVMVEYDPLTRICISFKCDSCEKCSVCAEDWRFSDFSKCEYQNKQEIRT